jgi:hypothetical protein
LISSYESNSEIIERRYCEISVNPFIYCFIIVVVFFTFFNIIPNYIDNIYAYSSNATHSSQVPDINAKSIYDTGTAVLGNNVKNLIILIPDEAHHGNGEAKENRFIVQSFLPQTAVINKGTKVIWFSGDVSHEHNIILADKSSSSDSKGLFDSGQIPENSDSNPMIFNAVGDFGYKSPNVSPEAVQKGFVMKGEVKVIDQPNKLLPSKISNNNPSANKDIQTIGVYMVPTKEVETYISDFQKKGFSIDSTHTFKDVRGKARGTNSEQTLLVWTAGPDISLDSVISTLKEITPTLPYK